jgi:WD40 repeat protein
MTSSSFSCLKIIKYVSVWCIMMCLFGCQSQESESSLELLCNVADKSVPMDIDFNPDGAMFATAGRYGEAILWRSSDCTKIDSYSINSDWFSSVAFGLEGKKVYFGTENGDVIIIDAASWLPITQYHAHDNTVIDIDMNRDDAVFGTTSLDGYAKIWKLSNNDMVTSLGGITSRVNTIDFFYSDTERILTSHGGGQKSEIIAVLWNALNGNEIERFSGHLGLFDILSTKQPQMAENWVDSGEDIVQSGDITSARFSSEGSRIATTSYDGALIIWDIATGKPIKQISAHEDATSSVSFSSDGKWILTTSWDGTCKLWDANTYDLMDVVSGNGTEIRLGTFSMDGKRIGAITLDGSMYIWTIRN